MKRAVVVVLAALPILVPALEARAMSCTVTSAIGVAFGAYDVFSPAHTESAGSITYECTGVGPADTISIELSTGSASSYFPRRLVHGAPLLDYNLYLDAARSSVWGNGMSGTGHYALVAPPDGSPTTVIVYGRVPGLQNVPAGVYSDTIVATVVF